GGPSTFSLAGTVGVNGTLPSISVPWQLGQFDGAYDACLDVAPSITLTISPGTVVKSYRGGDRDSSLCPDKGSGSLFNEGTLDAVGTATKPITFTSINDNTIGGATGTGNPTTDWTGIESSGAGSIDLEHANVRYGAGVDGYSNGQLTVIESSFTNT